MKKIHLDIPTFLFITNLNKFFKRKIKCFWDNMLHLIFSKSELWVAKKSRTHVSSCLRPIIWIDLHLSIDVYTRIRT